MSNISGMESSQGERRLIPKAETFAEASRLGLEPSDDRFDRFRAGGLIGDLAAVEGTTQRGFTVPQRQRFFALLDLCKRLGSKRPRASALAFWLCWYGATDTPAELVCEHIERTVLSQLRFLRRQYSRRRVPLKFANESERWRLAGMPWAKPFIRQALTSFVGNGIMLDILATVVGLVLRALFSKVAFETVAIILRRLLFMVGVKNVTPEAMRTIWNVAEEAFPLFTTNERQNALLAAVREVNAEDPRQIIDLVHFAHGVLWSMARVFPIYDIPTAPAVLDPKNDIEVTVNRLFPGAMVAVLALTRKVPHALGMRENLRAGNAHPIIEEFYQVRVVRDSILDYIRKGKS